MGGQDRSDRQPGERRVERGVVAPGPPQRRDRLRHRIVEHPVACRALTSAQRPDATARLGQVDQLEVQRERGDHRLRGAQIEAIELALEPLALERVVLVAQGDRALADALDELEQRRPRLLVDDLAEQGTEQAHLGGQRVARAGRPDAAWLPAASHGHTAAVLRNQAGTPPQPFATATFRTLVL